MSEVALPSIDHFFEAPALAYFCRGLFGSLPRSDQRRWAEVYVRGLVSVPGRKSIRRISELVVGADAVQSLQQFVNQSPWDWSPVRRALAEQVEEALRPRAWVVREAVFPKNGDGSVAVARQYAPSAGRVLNAQRGLAVFLAGDEGTCPVDWRLVIPRSWDAEDKRRSRARVPGEARFRPDWQYVLEIFDEMIDDWGLSAPPIVVDVDSEREVYPLLHGLEERGLSYVARVPGSTPVLLQGSQQRAQSASRPPTVGQLAAMSAKRGRTTLTWQQGAGAELARCQFVMATVPGFSTVGEIRHGRAYTRSRHVLAQWLSGQTKPNALWLTNLGSAGVVELSALLRARRRAEEDMRALAECGLRHFEGRSYPGWHHHVTLVSAAHGYRLVRRLQEESADDWMRQHA
ncbi:IS701 family transposase [Kitasatospora sp. NPDC005856]|uniref:IS701 family transposase n=1 Tax=Kitasatospora sp. NPDC005856 TaxID=3154566 RepID=UPI0033F12DF6